MEQEILAGKGVLVLAPLCARSQALCQVLCEAGARVAVLDSGGLGPSDREDGASWRACGTEWQGRVDVDAPGALDEAAEKIRRAIGRVDVLVAYPWLYEETPFSKLAAGDWRAYTVRPLEELFLLFRTFTGGMLERGEGRVILITLPQAKTGGWLTGGGAASCTVAAALCGMARAMAVEFAPRGVTVNTVLPLLHAADEETTLERLPVKRLPDDADVAGGVLFLASAAASYITGYSLDINSGLYMD